MQARDTGDLLDDLVRMVDQLNGSVSAIMLEMGGVPDPRFREPDRKSIRHRVHALENDRAVEKAIRNSYDRAWSRWQKIALFAISLGGFVLALLVFLGFGR